MSDHDDSFTVLWNKIMRRVQQLHVNNISETLKPLRNLIQVPTVSVEKSAYILKHPQPWPQLLHGCDEGRKAISGVFKSKL